MTHVTCMLTAKNRDQLRNPTLGNRVWATFKLTLNDRVVLDYATSVARKNLSAFCQRHDWK